MSGLPAAASDASCAPPTPAEGTFGELRVPGSSETRPAAVNNRGDIVGSYLDSQGRVHGFLYRDGAFFTIDAPGGVTTTATDINASGTIVGNVDGRGYILRNGAFTFVQAPGAFATSTTSINNRGVVGGIALEPNELDGREVGFVRSPDGTFERIAPAGFANALVRDIDNRGALLVNADLSQLLRIRGEYEAIEPCRPRDILVRITNRRGFVGVTDEPSLGMVLGLVQTDREYTTYQYPGGDQTVLSDVNASGVAVGQANDPVRGTIGFVFVPRP
jgi:probable HAF family extracellular repeat protein